MFGLMDKFKRAKHSSDIKKEYNKILKLEEKRISLCKEYKDSIPEEIEITQREILRNNFASLARLADDRDALINSISDISKGFYFNIQGTKPRLILSTYDLISGYMNDKNYNNEIKMTRIDTRMFASVTDNLISLENVFTNLKSKKINQKAKDKIAILANQKIVKKIHSFCDQFKGNEQLFKNYIFSGMQGLNEDDHWHNYNLMKDRLNFIGLLSMNFNLEDSEEFSIGPKDLIYVYTNRLFNLELNEFLSKIKTKKYDFILTVDQKIRGEILHD